MIRPGFYGWGTITNISKKHLTFFLVLTVLIFFVPSFFYAQESSVSQESEKNFVIGAPVGTGDLSGGTSIGDAQNRDSASEAEPSTLWLFIRMIAVLALVIALIYALVFFLKKGLYPKTPDNPFLKKAVSLSLGPGKSVQAITMPGAAWLVGVSEAGVNLIAEIKDKELIDALILEAEKAPAEKPKDFAQIFAAFSSTASQTEALLKKQRGRLGGKNE